MRCFCNVTALLVIYYEVKDRNSFLGVTIGAVFHKYYNLPLDILSSRADFLYH
jgi:hypothetical protein